MEVSDLMRFTVGPDTPLIRSDNRDMLLTSGCSPQMSSASSVQSTSQAAGPSWRDSLLKSIRENSVPKPKRTRTDAGALFAVGGVVFLCAMAFMFYVIVHQEGDDTSIPGMIEAANWAWMKIILSMILIIVLPIGIYVWQHFFYQGQRTLAPDVFAEFDRIPDRHPILLLRSFANDLGPWWVRSPGNMFEIAVVKGLRDLGPVIALGKPDEPLPPVGAARVYVKNEVWEPIVLEMMTASQLVVLFAGFTAGLRTEIRMIAERIDPSKVIIGISCVGSRRKRLATWQNFKQVTSDVFPALPEDPGDAMFLRFDQSWQPILAEEFPFGLKRVGRAARALAISATGHNPSTTPTNQ